MWSPIQQKKQDNRKNSGGGSWRWLETGGGGWTKFEKGQVSNIGNLHKIGVSTPLCQLCRDFRNFLSLHYKTTTPFPAPLHLVKISHLLHYSHFWKISSAPLWRRGFGLRLMHEIKTEDVYKDFSSNKEIIGFSNYWTKSKYYDDSNKLVIGKMRDEIRGIAI